MKVFIVTYGDYDDYQILDVFLSQESAEQYLREYEIKKDLTQPSTYTRGQIETWIAKG